MFGARSVVGCCILSHAAAAIRLRAPYSNDTSQASPSPPYSVASSTPRPILATGSLTSHHGLPTPTGFLQPSNATSIGSPNSTVAIVSNASCTVNVPSANIEWWYAATYYSAMGTFTNSAANWTNYLGQYLTVVPNRNGPFDIASAISSDTAWTETVTYDPDWEMYWTQYEPYTVTPVAATTSIVQRDFRPSLPPGNTFPARDVYLYMQSRSLDASVVIATSANSTSAMTSATPFLYFSAYEVEAETNGTVVTQTINLARPTALAYSVKNIESSATASGTLPVDFLQQIPQSACSPGMVQGTVTVLVVLDLTYIFMPHANPFIIHIESSVLGWGDDPIVMAQGSTNGQPFLMTLDPDPTPTQGGHGGPGALTRAASPTHGNPPQSVPSAQILASTPAPGGNSPGGSQIGPIQTTRTVGTIGTNPVVVAPSSVVVVGSRTITPGAPAVTIGGSSVSVAPSATAIVVNGQTSALPIVADPAKPSQTVGNLGGNPVVIGPSSIVAVGTVTLQPGGSPGLIGGNLVSLAPSGTAIIVGSRTSTLPNVIFPTGSTSSANPAAAPPPVLTIGSSTLTANAATQFWIAPGQTLTPGGTATVDGTLVSLGPSASFVVIAGSTQILPTAAPAGPTTQPEIVIGGSTITALPIQNSDNPSGNSGPTFVLSGQTLLPGEQITVGGTTVSLASSGSFVVVNGVTSTVANANIPLITPVPLTIGSSTFSALPGTGAPSFPIGSQLLTPGGVLTLNGQTISLSPSFSFIVVNGVTSSLGFAPTPAVTNPPLLTIGLHTYTAVQGTSFVIDGRTLTPGGVVVVNSTTISLAPGATQLVYGSGGRSTTSALFPATTALVSTTTLAAEPSAVPTQQGAAVTSKKGGGGGMSIRAPSRGGVLAAVAVVLAVVAGVPFA